MKKHFLALLMMFPFFVLAQSEELSNGDSTIKQASTAGSTWGMYSTVGLNGVGIGVFRGMSEKWSIRADASTFSRSQTSSQNDIYYSVSASLATAGVYADYRPFSGVFRGSVGAMVKAPSAQLVASPSSGSVTINDTAYPLSSGDQLSGKLEFPSVMPYIGIGWGLGKPLERGFKFMFDLGLAIGSPNVTLTGSGSTLTTTQAQSDISKAQQKINDELSKLPGLPVLTLGVSYVF